jgi:Domain of unknown function (DUF4145)
VLAMWIGPCVRRVAARARFRLPSGPVSFLTRDTAIRHFILRRPTDARPRAGLGISLVRPATSQRMNSDGGESGSCANRLRGSVEALLTDKKVARTTVNKKGKRERLSLHARLEKFKQKDPSSAEYLFAIKWLGNAGSHANLDELSRDELLDGFDLFELVMERVYVRREEHLKKIAKAITSRKGRPIKLRSAVF